VSESVRKKIEYCRRPLSFSFNLYSDFQLIRMLAGDYRTVRAAFYRNGEGWKAFPSNCSD
jgi:hypothetical protein